LLQLARKLIDDEEQFSLAVVVAHTACEVKVERWLYDSFARRGLTDLEEAILGRIRPYNMDAHRVRDLYNAMSGNVVQDQPFWQDFTTSVKRRNGIVHKGEIVGKPDAEASLDVAWKLVRYLN
jgi:hypothetical protein